MTDRDTEAAEAPVSPADAGMLRLFKNEDRRSKLSQRRVNIIVLELDKFRVAA